MVDTPADELAKKINEAAPDTAKPAEKKEEKKPVSTLESVVNETTHLFGNTIKLGLGGLIPYIHATAFPSMARDTAILTGAQVAADGTTWIKKGQKYTSKDALESSIVGTAITAPTVGMFSIANKIATDSLFGYAAKAAYWGGIAYPAFLGLYQTIDYTVRNKTFKGLGKYIKENYWPTLKFSWKYILPFSLLNVFFAPSTLQIPISAALSYMFALFGAPKKGEVSEEKKRDKTPYLVAAPTVAAKFVRNSVKGLYDAVYAVGSGMRDLYKTSPKTAAPAQPTPAPQPAH